MKVSSCCGAENGPAGEDGPNWSDICVCPECREHCEFVEDEDEDKQEGDKDELERSRD